MPCYATQAGELKVQIVRAEGLMAHSGESGPSDTYVTLRLGTRKHKTKTVLGYAMLYYAIPSWHGIAPSMLCDAMLCYAMLCYQDHAQGGDGNNGAALQRDVFFPRWSRRGG